MDSSTSSYEILYPMLGLNFKIGLTTSFVYLSSWPATKNLFFTFDGQQRSSAQLKFLMTACFKIIFMQNIILFLAKTRSSFFVM